MAQRVLVCVPVDLGQAALIAAGREVPGPLQVFEPNSELRASFGLDSADEEQAEFACLLVAGVWGLARFGRRLVLTAQVDPVRLGAGQESANGGRVLAALPADRVEAFFADEAAAPIAAVAKAVQGQGIDYAWELAQVEELHRTHDLMWHSVVELAGYLATQEGA